MPNGSYERGLLLRTYRARCAKFKSVFRDYLVGGFAQDLSRLFPAPILQPEASFSLADQPADVKPFLSDVKYLDETAAILSSSTRKHFSIEKNFQTSTLLRMIAPHDRVEVWLLGEVLPGLEVHVTLEDALVVADSHLPSSADDVSLQLGSRVFLGLEALTVDKDSYAVTK